jgi:hypothetical protein
VGVLKLLAEARAAGLIVQACGGKLVIEGPVQAEGVARKLGEHKAAVLAALSTSRATGVGTTGVVADPSEPGPCRFEEAKGTTHATITLGGKTYELRQIHAMWFFRLTPDAGWTCCSEELAKLIENNQASGHHAENH